MVQTFSILDFPLNISFVVYIHKDGISGQVFNHEDNVAERETHLISAILFLGIFLHLLRKVFIAGEYVKRRLSFEWMWHFEFLFLKRLKDRIR